VTRTILPGKIEKTTAGIIDKITDDLSKVKNAIEIFK
jgi:hypothetical protein